MQVKYRLKKTGRGKGYYTLSIKAENTKEQRDLAKAIKEAWGLKSGKEVANEQA